MKVIKYWIVKIFFISLIISVGVSVMSEYFIAELPLSSAVGILFVLIIVGILFDTVGVAVSVCDHASFKAMSAKKNKRAHYALKLLKNADVASNFCNDVIGDICGIVSGATGASIALRAIIFYSDLPDRAVSIAVSALIAAITITGKAWGKKIAFKKSREIVLFVGSMMRFFDFKERRRGKVRNNEKKD